MDTEQPKDTYQPTHPSATPLPKIWLTAGAIGVFAALITSLTQGLISQRGQAAGPEQTNSPPRANRQVNIVNLYDCQYLVFDPPFAIVHHGGCTNRHHVTVDK